MERWAVLIGVLGALTGIGGLTINIFKARWERKTQHLSASAERYRDMVENYHDGMLRVNSENKIIVANRQARLMTGYGLNDILGMSINNLIPIRFRKHHTIDVLHYVANPRVRMMGKSGRPLFLLRKSGEETQVLLSLTPGEPIDNGPEVTVGMRTVEPTMPVVLSSRDTDRQDDKPTATEAT